MQRGLQFFARLEVVALQHVFDTTVEPLHHTVGLRRSGRSQAVFDVQFRTEPVKLMLPALRPLSQAKETVGELFAIISQIGADPQWAGPLQIPQETPGVCGRLAVVNADKDPSRVARSIATHR